MPPPPWTPAQATACGWTPAVEAELSGDASALVAAARAAPTVLNSTLGEAAIQRRLSALLSFVLASFVWTCESWGLGTLNGLPYGQTYADQFANVTNNSYSLQLQGQVYLIDNALYAVGALARAGFAPHTGALLNASVFGASGLFNSAPITAPLCPEDQGLYAVGQLPLWDADGGVAGDPRCAAITPATVPGSEQYLARQQFPPLVSGPPFPVYAADAGVLIAPDGSHSVRVVSFNGTRDYLKYGCLRAVLHGDADAGAAFLARALAVFDGTGFYNPHNPLEYMSRDLALALMCASALGPARAARVAGWSAAQPQIEARLWALQDPGFGGVWDTYCATPGSPKWCLPWPPIAPAGLPNAAKLEHELSPLVLSAYGANVWTR